MTNIIRLFIFIVFTISAVSAIAEDQNTWINDGKAALNAAKQLQPNNRKAKNVILFIGDGMGISTVTGSRIFEGQQRGVDGERNQLSFEKLPYLALSKTYSANQQTPDSAPTMTAIVAGVKTNDGVLALNQNVKRGETNLAVIQANQVQTILEKAEANGLATGIISTARITHATPAATYAHIPDRDWENDEMLPASAEKTGVKDIAVQLVEQGKQSAGDGIDVMLGGGRKNFLPMDVQDPENPKKRGNRHDGRNLIAEYMQQDGAAYVWNKAQFDAINPKKNKTIVRFVSALTYAL